MSDQSKLNKLINSRLQHSKIKVKINGTLREQFEVNTGVKQGDPISALLLSIVMDVIMSKLEMRGTSSISTRLRQITAYAKDILVFARTKHSLTDKFMQLKEEAK
jgi:retron-type reverse transcriptase